MVGFRVLHLFPVTNERIFRQACSGAGKIEGPTLYRSNEQGRDAQKPAAEQDKNLNHIL